MRGKDENLKKNLKKKKRRINIAGKAGTTKGNNIVQVQSKIS